MPKTCTSCGYTTEQTESSRCPLCKSAFPNTTKILDNIARHVVDATGRTDSVQASQPAGSNALPGPNLLWLRIISCVTMMQGFLGASALASLGLLLSSRVHKFYFFMALVAFFGRGICGAVGAVYLWNGKKLGFQLSLVCWLATVAIGVIAITQLPYLPYDYSLYARHIGSTIGKLLFGIPIVIFLSRQLILLNRGIQPASGQADQETLQVSKG